MSNGIEEVLVAPISALIEEMGESVASAAIALNQAQLELARNQPKELLEVGVIPTFYHMQDVQVSLKMALQIEGAQSGRRGWRLFGAPINAQYKNSLNFDIEGSSKLKMTFAPGPPPLAVQSGED